MEINENSTLANLVSPAQYKVDVSKIKTIKDIKLILSHLDLHYKPECKEDYDAIKHLLFLN